jgi:hypothetical protein
MSETRCSCDRFEKLEGATVPAYISAFLATQGQTQDRFRCRWCNQVWERHQDQGNKRPSLVRVKSSSKE